MMTLNLLRVNKMKIVNSKAVIKMSKYTTINEEFKSKCALKLCQYKNVDLKYFQFLNAFIFVIFDHL
jgi:hypothetical protein